MAADPVTDDSLYDQVRIKIASDREVGGGNIEVKVTNGVVELTGTVATIVISSASKRLSRRSRA